MEKDIIITNDLSEIVSITRFIESLGMSLFLPANTIRRISLAIEEAITFIIRRAYPDGRKGSIQLKASVVNGDLTCMIINDGLPFDPTLPLKEQDTAPASEPAQLDNRSSLPKEDMVTGGLEFYIIYRTMDEVAYHINGNLNYLMLTKKIDASEEPESTLDVNICKVIDTFIVTIEGRLDTANARKFESEISPLRENKTAKIFINCEKLTYISSSGLRSFILLQKKISTQNGHLILVNMLPEIRRIFDMTGCTSIFTIH